MRGLVRTTSRSRSHPTPLSSQSSSSSLPRPTQQQQLPLHQQRKTLVSLQQQQKKNKHVDRILRTSFPLLTFMARLTYVILGLLCYAMVSTVWMDWQEHEATRLARQHQKELDSMTSSLDAELRTQGQSTTKRRGSTARSLGGGGAGLTDSIPLEELHIDNAAVSAKKNDKPAIVVAYVVVITSCSGHGLDIPFHIAEGAAVLRHSIHQQSVHGTTGGRYDYQLYALYHPDAKDCALALEPLGYTLSARETPVAVADMRGDFLRERVPKNGCCGEKELIKLEAFTLTKHEVVVLLDLDVLVLKPLDRLFDFVRDSRQRPREDDLLTRKDTVIPERVDLLYTTDYAMVDPERKIKPTQGGFVVLRPNQTVYEDYVEILKEGDFREFGGWGGKTGKFWGAMTFQGLMPYYWQVLHPGRAVELNWCVWDNMCSPSRTLKGKGKCFTEQEDCEDCRNRPISDVSLLHFTVCQKPWTCQRMAKDMIEHRLCRQFHHAWFQVRSDMEKSWGRSAIGTGDYDQDHFLGFCQSFGQKGYNMIDKPFGALAAKA